MAEKPFAQIPKSQQDAYIDALKGDAVEIGKHLGGAVIEYLSTHPESPIAQTAMEIENATGSLTMLARAFKAIAAERAAKRAATAGSDPKNRTIDVVLIDPSSKSRK